MTTAVLSIPKLDLLAATENQDPIVAGTLARDGLGFPTQSGNYTLVSTEPVTEGIYNQAVVSYDPTSTAYTIGLEGHVDGSGATAFTSTSLTAFSLYSTQVELTSITGGGSSDAIVNAPTDVTLPVTYADPIDAPQPDEADPVQATVIPGNSVFITFDGATNYPSERYVLRSTTAWQTTGLTAD